MKNKNYRRNRAWRSIGVILFFFMCQGVAIAENNNQKPLFRKNLLIVKEAFKAYGELLTEAKQQDERAEKQINDELLGYVKNLEKWINISFDDPSLKSDEVRGLARAERKALLISRLNEMTACILGLNIELKSDPSLKNKLRILSRQLDSLENE